MTIGSRRTIGPRSASDRRTLLQGVLAAAVSPAVGFKPILAKAAIAAGSVDKRNALTVVKDDLIAAGHILTRENVVDAFGHVSARHPTRPDHFLMCRARAPGLTVIADVMEFDRDGEPVDAQGLRPYLERYIHSGVYQLRPDVRAIVHHHSEAVLPFSVSTVPLRPAGNTGGVIGERVPVWDIRDHFGDSTNMLVSTQKIGVDLATRLGHAPVLLMRGHGAVIAAQSIRLATFTAISLDEQARLQREAMNFGAFNGLTAGEIAATAHLYDPGKPGDILNRAWEYWCARANVRFHVRGA
jgi:ribulose-5-phosphate 4-epimerase/fuculose-1-phosphate aldolase